MNINNSQTLISKESSTAIKGFSILLIILGHNHLLMEYADTTTSQPNLLFIQKYLYLFHVYIFFYLPFLYGFRSLSIKYLQKLFLKLFVPYVIFLAICTIASSIVIKLSVSPKLLFLALATGSQVITSEACGFAYLWFLPTMFYVLVGRDIYYNLSLLRKVFFWLFTVILQITQFAGLWYLLDHNPISSYGRIYLIIACGIICRYIIKKANSAVWLKKILLFTSGIIMLLPVIYEYYKYLIPNKLIIYIARTLPIIVSIAAFFIIYYSKSILSKNNLCRIFGKYSFEIYLRHIFIYQILSFSIPHGKDLGRYDIGILLYAATVVLSFCCALLLNKMPYIKRIIFPTSR